MLRLRVMQLMMVLAAGCAGGLVWAQITPDAPIQNFRLPMFGENGYKTWELRGIEGTYVREGEALVEGLDLLVFNGTSAVLLENRIRSPRAMIYFKEARAESESSLFVSGENFEIEGQNWTWDGKSQTITVRSNARVSFAGDLEILR